MKIKNRILILSSVITLSSCSAIAPSGTEAAFKYLGIAKGAADVVSYSQTGKSVNDHLLSAAIGQDCRLARVIAKKPICIQFDSKSHKYSIFNRGKVVSKDNIVEMKFPSEIYDFNKTLEKNLKKKLKNPNLKLSK